MVQILLKHFLNHKKESFSCKILDGRLQNFVGLTILETVFSTAARYLNQSSRTKEDEYTLGVVYGLGVRIRHVLSVITSDVIIMRTQRALVIL